ncbi:MAG: hypothetical protein KC964_11330 [Candidatus Omnitrophica bacterium]|nr:hypothetical protein [Candidatus Omnitrophota bacterium]
MKHVRSKEGWLKRSVIERTLKGIGKRITKIRKGKEGKTEEWKKAFDKAYLMRNKGEEKKNKRRSQERLPILKRERIWLCQQCQTYLPASRYLLNVHCPICTKKMIEEEILIRDENALEASQREIRAAIKQARNEDPYRD